MLGRVAMSVLRQARSGLRIPPGHEETSLPHFVRLAPSFTHKAVLTRPFSEIEALHKKIASLERSVSMSASRPPRSRNALRPLLLRCTRSAPQSTLKRHGFAAWSPNTSWTNVSISAILAS